jgi:hypothetical protein
VVDRNALPLGKRGALGQPTLGHRQTDSSCSQCPLCPPPSWLTLCLSGLCCQHEQRPGTPRSGNHPRAQAAARCSDRGQAAGPHWLPWLHQLSFRADGVARSSVVLCRASHKMATQCRHPKTATHTNTNQQVYQLWCGCRLVWQWKLTEKVIGAAGSPICAPPCWVVRVVGPDGRGRPPTTRLRWKTRLLAPHNDGPGTSKKLPQCGGACAVCCVMAVCCVPSVLIELWCACVRASGQAIMRVAWRTSFPPRAAYGRGLSCKRRTLHRWLTLPVCHPQLHSRARVSR